MDFAALLREYREDGLQPEDLPLWFWDQGTCPPFEPPTGVFLYYAGQTALSSDGPSTHIYRTAGWSKSKSGVVHSQEGLHNDQRTGRTGTSVPGSFDYGTPLPAYQRENDEYTGAEHRWRNCYERARREILEVGGPAR